MSSRNKLKRQSCFNCTSTSHDSTSTSTEIAVLTTTFTTTTTSAQPSSSSSTTSTASSSSSDAGAIAGGVVGGVLFLLSLLLALLLFLRRRKRRRTAPSSEFMNSIKDGAAPVLRLDSGAEYIPAIPEKGGPVHYPPTVPTVPLPFMQNSYYPSPPVQNMRFPDEMVTPSQRPSLDRPLHPQRYSSQHGHDVCTSVGSRRELFGSDTEIDLVPVRQSSPRADSVVQFAPRFSLDEPQPQTVRLSQSPTSLQPLRRQPD